MEILQNGYYIPFLHAGLYIITNDIYLSSIITLKTYSANYFYWFSNHYSYLPNRQYNWVKQFIRFTDTGHIASFLYYFYPQTLPIAFNIHFVITFGYWGGRVAFKMKDSDQLQLTTIDHRFEEMWTSMVHGVPIVLLSNRILHQDVCMLYSDEYLRISYIWLYIWFFGIYLPWRYYTGDYVYNVISDFTDYKKIISFGLFIHMIIFLGHMIGSSLNEYACTTMTNSSNAFRNLNML
jgi:hypothetical protein